MRYIEDLRVIFRDEFGLDDLSTESPIFSSNLLDSMDVLRLIVLLQEKYNISIPAFDLTIEMLYSVQLIANYLSSEVDNSS